MKTVSINRDALKDSLRPLLQAALKKRVEAGVWSHVNKDDKMQFSPAQWWVDAQNSVRHSLETGISASMTGSVISINLNFNIIDIS